ncbi:MAG TPA: TRAP transporter large permease [Candidatus Ruania gallistercoris]|uniref:TRAP transporter large permease n=1 Tax=Candidatus Ruania gallistercoris TaxID=2838746 RepID=A0A9D2EH26_9MICO|nr:TRAP transporter large permease [Candidatus Ruania gallistercoris]
MDDAFLVTGILIIGMFGLMAIGVSVSVAIGLPAAISLVILQSPEQGAFTAAQKIFNGLDSFALLAIPLFVLAGAIMNNGGIAARLIDLAKVLTGRAPGALAQTNVVANMLFGSISGSALAGAAAVGSSMAPRQRADGYDMRWAAAANVASAPAGMLIPPSNTLIVYALVSQTSVGALFLAGYIPGVLWGAACLVIVWLYARKRPNLRGDGYPTFRVFLLVLWRAVPSLLLVLIVIGGIMFGFFTPTEGAAVSVVVSAALALMYRAVKVRDFYQILLQATRTSSVVIFLIALSTIMSFAMTYARVPQLIAEWMTSITDSKVVFLLIMMVILLIIGIPLDATPAVLIFTPIFLPIAVEYGISPIHFGIMIVFNMCIAVISPPSAPVLFVGAKVAEVRVEKVFKPLMWFYISLVIMLLIIQFVPALSMWLPETFGVA